MHGILKTKAHLIMIALTNFILK